MRFVLLLQIKTDQGGLRTKCLIQNVEDLNITDVSIMS